MDHSTLRRGRGMAATDGIPSVDIPRVLDRWLDQFSDQGRKEPFRQRRFEDRQRFRFQRFETVQDFR